MDDEKPMTLAAAVIDYLQHPSIDGKQVRQEKRARLAELAKIDGEMQLREMLWLAHGCHINALYGDDGEMQCNRCHIDFKREAVSEIKAILERNGIAKLSNLQKEP